MTTTANQTRSSISIPWGEGSPLRLEVPEPWEVAGVAWPDLSNPLDDYPAALRRALDNPDGGLNLDAAQPGATVAIVVDDPSRWTPVREALPVVVGRLLDAGVRCADISISFGVGRHHAVDAETMRLRVGPALADAHRCFSPPVDDLSAYDDLGSTPEGVPVRVFRPVARADLRVLIGSVLPHLQAGLAAATS